MKNKKTLIIGVTSQEGSYLAKFLLKRNIKLRFTWSKKKKIK